MTLELENVALSEFFFSDGSSTMFYCYLREFDHTLGLFFPSDLIMITFVRSRRGCVLIKYLYLGEHQKKKLKLPRKCQRRQNSKITPSSAPPEKEKNARRHFDKMV